MSIYDDPIVMFDWPTDIEDPCVWEWHLGMPEWQEHLGQHLDWTVEFGDLPNINSLPHRPDHTWQGVGVGHTSHGNGNGFGHLDCPIPPAIPGPGTAVLLFLAGAVLCTWVLRKRT